MRGSTRSSAGIWAAPGRAATFDGLLSYRLAAGTPATGERIALLFERAQHRLTVARGSPGGLSRLQADLEDQSE